MDSTLIDVGYWENDMYVDENVSMNMWWRDEWIMLWISTDINYVKILQTYERSMNDISEEYVYNSERIL